MKMPVVREAVRRTQPIHSKIVARKLVREEAGLQIDAAVWWKTGAGYANTRVLCNMGEEGSFDSKEVAGHRPG